MILIEGVVGGILNKKQKYDRKREVNIKRREIVDFLFTKNVFDLKGIDRNRIEQAVHNCSVDDLQKILNMQNMLENYVSSAVYWWRNGIKHIKEINDDMNKYKQEIEKSLNMRFKFTDSVNNFLEMALEQ